MPPQKTGKTAKIKKEPGTVKIKKEPGTKSVKKEVKDESQYENFTDVEHLRKRAPMYGGQKEPQKVERWIYDGDRYTKKTIILSEFFETMFDEILVNAADQQKKDTQLKNIRVWITPKSVTVENDGQGIPLNKKINVRSTGEQLWSPTMLFGRCRSGENFEDDRDAGGMNGMGTKVTNSHCKVFTVTTQHPKSKNFFEQTWTDGMRHESDPVIRKMTTKDPTYGFVRVYFEPDFEELGIKKIEKDVIDLFKTRVYDVAGFIKPNITVYFNNEKVPIKDFNDYSNLFFGEETPRVLLQIKNPDNKKFFSFQLAIAPSDEGFKCHTIVNGLKPNDGTHVRHVIQEKLGKLMVAEAKRRNKDGTYQPAMFRDHIFAVFIIDIVKPEFGSQKKTEFTSKPSSWGFELKFPKSFLDKLKGSEMGIVDSMIQLNAFKQARAFKRQTNTKTSRVGRVSIEKLDDAINAKNPRTSDCTLILTEGDSAKDLAMTGLGIIGNDDYGAFPLRGKLKNVRDVSVSKLMQNEEVKNIIEAINLEYGKTYENKKDIETLRYKRIWIFTDADHDGYHIAGLIINFIEHFWPSILENMPGFLQLFVSPIIKIYPSGSTGIRQAEQTKYFTTLPSFKKWTKTNNVSKYEVMYLKGLASSESYDAEIYFSNISKYVKPLVYTGRDTNEILDIVFNKKRSDERKRWLEGYDPNATIDFDKVDSITIPDFINNLFIHFSMYDNIRSMPDAIDGFKPSQRKALYGMLKKKYTSPTKLSLAASFVSAESAYHHGEVSLIETIVSMAQDHHGTNNINLFQPKGAFGTRHNKRDVHGAARYLFTCLDPITNSLFVADDNDVLDYEVDDGKTIEPSRFMPIIPMVLVNGTSGIGTGWSSEVPCYNPLDICDRVGVILNDYERFRKNYETGASSSNIDKLIPWYSEFRGDVISCDDGKYILRGKIEVDGDVITIIDPPPGTWKTDLLAKLEKLTIGSGSEKKDAFIKYIETHSDRFTIKIKVFCDHDALENIISSSPDKSLTSILGLEQRVSASNIHLFDVEKRLRRFSSPEEIIEYFCYHRIETYGKRKERIVQKLEYESLELENKRRYLQMIMDDEYSVHRKPIDQIDRELEDLGFDRLVLKPKYRSERGDEVASYNYLGKMSQWATSRDKIDKLRRQCDEKLAQLEIVRKTSLIDMWRSDIDNFIVSYSKFLKNKEDVRNSVVKKVGGGAAKAKRKSAKRAPKSSAKRQKTK